MPKINVLSEEIAQLIAAGEVVERPSSVIKELVENSIDAGATVIEVEISGGGASLMRVTDNGCGIDRSDIKTAFLRHATSKLSLESDLDRIATLGFRGEALASIAAVSKVHIISKTENSDEGVSYEIIGGEEGALSEVGCPNGTTIVVENLFFNTPARFKFLKKDVSEANAVAAVVDKIALSHPEIAVRLIRDSRQVLNTPGDNKLKSAIYAIYGREFVSGLMKVSYEYDGIQVEGYVSKPSFARANRNMQNFFINGRYVKSRTAMAALEQAFKGSIVSGKFPSCVLHITINASAVDVNVHPAKIEVRFIDEKPMFQAIYHAVKSALLQKDTNKRATFEHRGEGMTQTREDYEQRNTARKTEYAKELGQLSGEENNQIGISTEELEEPEVFKPKKALTLRDSLDTDEILRDWYKAPAKPAEDTQVAQIKEDTVSEQATKEIPDNPAPKPMKYLAQAFKTYILLECGEDELVLIDKHAAHERLIYERLKAEGEQISQTLLEPIVVALEKNEYAALLENKTEIARLGFDVEGFGEGSIIVRSVPLEIDDIRDAIAEIAGYLLLNKNDITPKKMDWVYHNVACRAAIKAGDINDKDELIKLVTDLQNNTDVKYCPHGRPIRIVITKKEIEKQFGR